MVKARDRPVSEAEPPLKAVAEGPLSPRRSTNIAESSREPEGRLSTAEQESEQREAILQRIHELEAENAPAERKEAAKARKKTLKDLRALLDDSSQPDEGKIAWLQNKVVELVSAQAKLENQLIPAHKRESLARKEKDEALAELQRTKEVCQKLQELSRLLQQQNKDIVERAKDIQEQDQKNLKAYEDEVAKTLGLINEKIQEDKVNREQQETDNAQLRTKLEELDAKWGSREDIFAKQMDAKDQEVKLWRERCERQEELLTGAMEREAALQGHLEGARASGGEAAIEKHLAKYAEYQDAITKSNELMKQLQEADKTKDATIKVLMKGKRLLEKQLQQTAQVSEESTAALKKAVQHNKTLMGLVTAAGGPQAVQALPRMQLQKATLENLCRTLRQENQQYKAQLGIATPADTASSEHVPSQGASVAANAGSPQHDSADSLSALLDQHLEAVAADSDPPAAAGASQGPEEDPAAVQSKVDSTGLQALEISPEQ